MVSLLNLGILQHFTGIFIFLFVFALIYAALSKSKFFGGEKQGLYAIIAFVVAILIVSSNFALRLVEIVVPWYTALAIVAFLVLLVYGVLGAKEEHLDSVVKSGQLRSWIIGFGVAILIFGLAFTFGEELRKVGYPSNESSQTPVNQTFNPAGENFSSELVKTIFHPAMLGLIMLFLIAMFTILFLTKTEK